MKIKSLLTICSILAIPFAALAQQPVAEDTATRLIAISEEALQDVLSNSEDLAQTVDGRFWVRNPNLNSNGVEAGNPQWVTLGSTVDPQTQEPIIEINPGYPVINLEFIGVPMPEGVNCLLGRIRYASPIQAAQVIVDKEMSVTVEQLLNGVALHSPTTWGVTVTAAGEGLWIAVK